MPTNPTPSIGDLVEQRGKIHLENADSYSKKGFTQIPNVILEHPDISMGAKMIYSLLMKYYWRDGRVYPGQKKLAELSGASVRSVISYLNELKKQKLIRVKRNGFGKTNDYFLSAIVSPKKYHVDK